MNYLQIPRFKVPKKLPEILTRDEITEFFNHCTNIKHKALLLLAYGSGLRVGEIVRLKVKDIDSASMRVFVRGGKGKKDRYTILSEVALHALRDYWRKYRPKSSEGYLFPGMKNVGHISEAAVANAIDSVLARTSISKNVSPHTFRHCFSTHLLEDGYSLFQIKEMLGHSSLSSTTLYLHLADTTSGVISPADNIPVAKFEDFPI
jgi:site-specific recombinase XerD